MGFSPLIAYTRPTSESYSRNGVRVDLFIIHHAATTSLEGVLSLFQPGGRTVSATYALGADGTLVGCVDESRSPFSVAAQTVERRAVSVETVNSTGGPDWGVSQAAHEKLAQLAADLHTRLGIPLDRSHIIGHREVLQRFGAGYATACPGNINLDWIVNRAREILGLGPAPTGTPGTGSSAIGRNITSRPTPDIQTLVGAIPDGIYGADTTAKVKVFQAANGLVADGIWGPLSDAKGFPPASSPAPALAAPPFPLPAGSYFGPKEGPVESVSGYFGVGEGLARWQQRMIDRGWIFRYGADGRYGPETRENAIAFQREKGILVDGLIGPQTWKAAWEAPVT